MTTQPDGDQLASLVARLADLEQVVRTQQAEIDTLRAREAGPLAAPMAADDGSAAAAVLALAGAKPPTAPEGRAAQASRRALLKLGGAAAAAGVAAMAAGATELAHPGTAQAHADTVGLYSNINGVGNVAIKGDGGQGANGVEGTTDSGFGLYGLSFTGDAVHAKATQGGKAVNADSSTGVGVYGTSSSGVGVFGSSSSSVGVAGYSPFGIGVDGTSVNSTGVTGSGNYGGYFSGNTASLVVGKNASLVGPPNTGNHQKGELVTDSNGLLWFCINDGRPGTWIRLSGALSDYQGGAINYLPAPVRLLAAINGATGSLVNCPALGPLEVFSLTVAGLSGSGIPASAQGLIANVTVLGPSQGGNLSLFPTGAAIPTTASMTYGQGVYLANGVNVAIGTGGQVNLQNQSSGTTPLVVDAVAFVS
jgi:hypothetical protein